MAVRFDDSKDYVFEFPKISDQTWYTATINSTSTNNCILYPIETMPPMVKSYSNKYPYEVSPLTIEQAESLLNTKFYIKVCSYTKDNEIESYTIEIKPDNDLIIDKYVFLSQELLEASELIYPDEHDSTIMHIGYIDCEVIGYVSLPYKAYVLRIIENV